MMAEKGLSEGDVKGSGRDGRIMKEDVQSASKSAAPAAPAMPRSPVAADDAVREERVKMTRLRQTIARRLKEAQDTAAMLTTYNEVDMTAYRAGNACPRRKALHGGNAGRNIHDFERWRLRISHVLSNS